jgi:hypothetical protein
MRTRSSLTCPNNRVNDTVNKRVSDAIREPDWKVSPGRLERVVQAHMLTKYAPRMEP